MKTYFQGMGDGTADLRFRELTAARWEDLASLFGERGAYGGCWCMWFRTSRAEFARRKGAGNRAALRRLAARGETLGILAYAGREPVGWCAVAPRAEYAHLGRAAAPGPAEDGLWSITCFFVAPAWRRRGVSSALLGEAVRFARRRRARAVEAYPVRTGTGELPDDRLYHGSAGLFEARGFREIRALSADRPVLRLDLD